MRTLEITLALETLHDELKSHALELLEWAAESRNGGWSTHQVKKNVDMAVTLRVNAMTLKKIIEVLREERCNRSES